jgi:hypothetical protein
LGVGDGELSVFDWKLVRELEEFGFLSSLEDRHGMILHNRHQDKDWRVFIRGLSSFIVSWTSFGGTFGKIGRIFGNSDSAGNNKPHSQQLFSSLFSVFLDCDGFCCILIISLVYYLPFLIQSSSRYSHKTQQIHGVALRGTIPPWSGDGIRLP